MRSRKWMFTVLLLCGGLWAADAVIQALTAREATRLVNLENPTPCAHEESVKDGFIIVKQSYASKCWEQALLHLEKRAPELASVDEPYTFTITAKNMTKVALKGVEVVDTVPEGFDVSATEPAAQVNGKTLSWVFDIDAGQQVSVQVTGVPRNEGIVYHMGTVCWRKPLLIATKVVRPNVDVIKEGPAVATVGEEYKYQIRVVNTGSGTAKNVELQEKMPDGVRLLGVYETKAVKKRWSRGESTESVERGTGPEFHVGDLAPGEERVYTVRALAERPGVMKNTVLVRRPGDKGIEKTVITEVRKPELTIVKNGPRVVLLDNEALYSVEVKNPGNTVTQDVVIDDTFVGGEAVAASDGGVINGNNVRWAVGALEPGHSATRTLRIKATDLGQIDNTATATGRFVPGVTSRVQTQVIGFSGVLIEVVDITDPIVVGGVGVFEVKVTNQSRVSEKNLRVWAQVDDLLAVTEARGATPAQLDGNKVTFGAVDELTGGSSVKWFITVNGVKAGDSRATVYMQVERMTKPVVEVESTNVYDAR